MRRRLGIVAGCKRLRSAAGALRCRRKGVQVVARRSAIAASTSLSTAQPFTSYIWPTTLKKPVLYPLIDDDGVTVTRGYPLEPRPGERVDHPHHAGLWFNYGNVNGFDFWNNSDAIKPERAPRWARFFQTKSSPAKSGTRPRRAGHRFRLDRRADGKQILTQTTHYIFAARRARRAVIDLIVNSEGARRRCLQ